MAIERFHTITGMWDPARLSISSTPVEAGTPPSSKEASLILAPGAGAGCRATLPLSLVSVVRAFGARLRISRPAFPVDSVRAARAAGVAPTPPPLLGIRLGQPPQARLGRPCGSPFPSQNPRCRIGGGGWLKVGGERREGKATRCGPKRCRARVSFSPNAGLLSGLLSVREFDFDGKKVRLRRSGNGRGTAGGDWATGQWRPANEGGPRNPRTADRAMAAPSRSGGAGRGRRLNRPWERAAAAGLEPGIPSGRLGSVGWVQARGAPMSA